MLGQKLDPRKELKKVGSSDARTAEIRVEDGLFVGI